MDLLLRFPDSATAVAFGQSIGATPVDGPIVAVHDGMAIAVIGEHVVIPAGSSMDNPLPAVPVPGWWVLVRAPDGMPVPPQILPLIVQPDPENPLIPNRQWA